MPGFKPKFAAPKIVSPTNQEKSGDTKTAVCDTNKIKSAKKKSTVSLTDSQYEDLFSTVSKRVLEKNFLDLDERFVGSQEMEEDVDKSEEQPKKKKHNGNKENTAPEVEGSGNENQERADPSESFTKFVLKISPTLNKQENEITPVVSPHEVSNVLINKPKPKLQPIKRKPAFQSKRKSLEYSEISENDRSISPSKFETSNGETCESGTWVQCTSCEKWRRLPHCDDPALLPDVWTCSMNPVTKYSKCNAPEESWEDDGSDTEYIYTRFSLGSVVWAKMPGYPSWPAMVDLDPDSDMFCEMSKAGHATHYHVVFLDEEVSRAWISDRNIEVFRGDETPVKLPCENFCKNEYAKELHSAKARACQAVKMKVTDRIETFCFVNRFRGSSHWSRDRNSREKSHKRKLSKMLSVSKDKSRKTDHFVAAAKTDVAKKADNKEADDIASFEIELPAVVGKSSTPKKSAPEMESLPENEMSDQVNVESAPEIKLLPENKKHSPENAEYAPEMESLPENEMLGQENVESALQMETLPENDKSSQENVKSAREMEALPENNKSSQENVECASDVESFPENRMSGQENIKFTPEMESLPENNKSSQENVECATDMESLHENEMSGQESIESASAIESLPEDDKSCHENVESAPEMESTPENDKSGQEDVESASDLKSLPENEKSSLENVMSIQNEVLESGARNLEEGTESEDPSMISVSDDPEPEKDSLPTNSTLDWENAAESAPNSAVNSKLVDSKDAYESKDASMVSVSDVSFGKEYEDVLKMGLRAEDFDTSLNLPFISPSKRPSEFFAESEAELLSTKTDCESQMSPENPQQCQSKLYEDQRHSGQGDGVSVHLLADKENPWLSRKDAAGLSAVSLFDSATAEEVDAQDEIETWEEFESMSMDIPDCL